MSTARTWVAPNTAGRRGRARPAHAPPPFASAAEQLLTRARHGDSRWFTVDDARHASRRAHEVADVTRTRYPELAHPVPQPLAPLRGRRRRPQGPLDRLLGRRCRDMRAHAMIDLAVVSVLLDAGAGPDWHYVEPATGQTFTRSEGLAVASFHAFTGGLFSSDTDHPLQADADGPARAGHRPPGRGVPGRARTIRWWAWKGAPSCCAAWARRWREQPEVFGEDGRPGGLLDMIIGRWARMSPTRPTLTRTTSCRSF